MALYETPTKGKTMIISPAIRIEPGMSFDHFDKEAIVTLVEPTKLGEIAIRYMIKMDDGNYTCFSACVPELHVFTLYTKN
jgi:hypothetical protein